MECVTDSAALHALKKAILDVAAYCTAARDPTLRDTSAELEHMRVVGHDLQIVGGLLDRGAAFAASHEFCHELLQYSTALRQLQSCVWRRYAYTIREVHRVKVRLAALRGAGSWCSYVQLLRQP